MKVKDLKTAEPYSKIASRSKLCLEVEQRGRLGSWLNRVLVLDKATLYSYRTKGENGSLNGWAIGGAEVHAKKARKDGRYVIVISRPDVYSIVFSLNSLHEQAAFIQALSTSGAIIRGLNGILLLKEFKGIQTAVSESLEEQKIINEENESRLRDLKGRRTSKPILTIPQLSSRMTEMKWTFSNSGIADDVYNDDDDDYKDGHVASPTHKLCPDTILKSHSTYNIEIIEKTNENRCNNINSKTSCKENTPAIFEKEHKHSFQNAKPDTNFGDCKKKENQSRLYIETEVIPFKEELQERIKSKEITEEKNGKAVKEEIIKSQFSNLKTGKVLEMKNRLESKRNQSTIYTSFCKEPRKEITSSNLQDERFETRRKNVSTTESFKQDVEKDVKNTSPIDEPTTANSGERRQIKDRINRMILKENIDDKKRQDTKRVETEIVNDEKTKNCEKEELNFDKRKIRFSLGEDGGDSEVILSGMIGVAQRVGDEFTSQKVVLRRGMMIIYPLIKNEGRKRSFSFQKPGNLESVVRINLEGLSICPLLGNNSDSLVMRRKNKCVKVLQLETREELMKWIYAISDEVVTVTPLIKRNSLTLYPTPSKISRKGEKFKKISQDNSPLSKSKSESEPECDIRMINDNDGKNSTLDEKPLKEFKNSKNTEKNSETVFKGLKRRLGIRRPSREIDKTLFVKEVEECSSSKQEIGSKKDNTGNTESAGSTHSVHKTSNQKLITDTDLTEDHSSMLGSHVTSRPVDEVLEGFFDIVDMSSLVDHELPVNSKLNNNNISEITSSLPVMPKSCTEDDDNYQKTKCPKNANWKSVDQENSKLKIEHKNNRCTYKLRENNFVKNFNTDNFPERTPEISGNNYSKFKRSPIITRVRVKDMIKSFDEISELAASQQISRPVLRNIPNKIQGEVKDGRTKINFNSSSSRDSKEKMDIPINIENVSYSSSKNYLSPEELQKQGQTLDYNDASNEGREKDVSRKMFKEENNNNDDDKGENESLKMTRSVRAIRERFEILSKVNGLNLPKKQSWSRNSINRRKQTRNSIRRKKNLEGESRRASLRRSVRRTDSGIRKPSCDEEISLKSVHLRNMTAKTDENNSNLVDEMNGKLNDEIDTTPFMRSYSFNSKKSIIVARKDRLQPPNYGSLSRLDPLLLKYGDSQSSFIEPKLSENQNKNISGLVLRKENEESVLENLNNTFLAKRLLVAKEVELARIQDSLVREEEVIWDIQIKIYAILSSKNYPPSWKDGSTTDRKGLEAVEDLKTLETDLKTAKTKYEILEDQLTEAEQQVNIAKQKIELNIRKTLE